MSEFNYLKGYINNTNTNFGKKKTKRKNFQIGKKKEKIIKIYVSKNNKKKYTAEIINKQTKKTKLIHFGARGYEQYKDSTKIKKYKSKDHLDSKRRMNYFSRHSGVKTKTEALRKEWLKSKGNFNAKILSHMYLW
jgi:hypothetical protein